MEFITVIFTREQYEAAIRANELAQDSATASADVLAVYAPATATAHREHAALFGNVVAALRVNCWPGNLAAKLAAATAQAPSHRHDPSPLQSTHDDTTHHTPIRPARGPDLRAGTGAGRCQSAGIDGTAPTHRRRLQARRDGQLA